MSRKLVRKRRKQKRKPMKGKTRALLTVFLCLLAASALGGSYLAYAFLLRGQRESATLAVATNTSAAMYTTDRQMLSRMKRRFPGLAALVKDTVVIPGLKSTLTLQGDFQALDTCTSMTPQGLCVSEDYIFVSAYCHAHRHNSVIYMIDRKTKRLLKTIPLASKAHVGGMAYDPVHRNVWVSGGTKGSAKAIAYSLESLEAYDIHTKKAVRAKFNYTLATITRNSYMSYADGALLIGYFTSSGLSEIERFSLTEEGGLNAQIFLEYDKIHESVVADYSVITSGHVQGAAKTESYMFFSKSFGIADSKLQIFKNKANRTAFREKDAETVWRFPQKLEQIYAADNQLYCLFESAADAYRAQPALKLDRILVFDIADLVRGEA